VTTTLQIVYGTTFRAFTMTKFVVATPNIVWHYFPFMGNFVVANFDMFVTLVN